MSEKTFVAVVGDALLDRDVSGVVERLIPDAPAPVLDETGTRSRPGGAALAAALALREGSEVALITALGPDAAGRELLALLEEAGVRVMDLGLDGATPEKVRFVAGGRPLLRLDRGGSPGEPGAPTKEARNVLREASGVLVSDYGRGLAAGPGLREELRRYACRRPLVWDPHPRGARPVGGARLVTPNLPEAEGFARRDGEGPARLARRLVDLWRAGGVAVTLGARGALLASPEGEPRLFSAPPAPGGDSCGAGDRFAAAAVGALAAGASTDEAVRRAVLEASSFVAGGGAAGFEVGGKGRVEEEPDAVELARRVRARGGTVVATGGCFDLLHGGHVGMLRAARALGDCLIVCLNSDESVGRLKGSDRPLVGERERAEVLLALGCVDAVEVFGEDTPEAALGRLRPHVFAKGGDYEVRDLPEAALVERWGGRVEILPYREGRSTTRLIEAARLGSNPETFR